MIYKAEQSLDLIVGDNRIHFDEGEVKDLSFPEGFELPEGLVGEKNKRNVAAKEAPAKSVRKRASKKK